MNVNIDLKLLLLCLSILFGLLFSITPLFYSIRSLNDSRRAYMNVSLDGLVLDYKLLQAKGCFYSHRDLEKVIRYDFKLMKNIINTKNQKEVKGILLKSYQNSKICSLEVEDRDIKQLIIDINNFKDEIKKYKR